MSKIKMVVFDMAGTTIKDQDAVHLALIKTMEKFNYSVTRSEANAVMGYPKPEAIKLLLSDKESDNALITPDFIRFLHSAFVKEMKSHYENTVIEPTENAIETFNNLRERGIKVCLDTGFSKDITEVILNQLGWLSNGKVDFAISSDEVRLGRPHPYMIQALMKKCGISNPKEVAKVGDTIADLEEGNNAEVGLVIGVCNGAYSRNELENHAHSHLIAHLGELPALLD